MNISIYNDFNYSGKGICSGISRGRHSKLIYNEICYCILVTFVVDARFGDQELN